MIPQEATAGARDAGFVEVEVHPFVPGSLTRITEKKPR
jgi:hypothetical protein